MAYIFTYLLVTQIKRNDLKIIVILITLESVFIFIEIFLGETTIFTSNPDYRSGLSFDALYLIRPFGLSDGTNSMGGKLVIAIILLDYLWEPSRLKQFNKYFLFLALIIVFSRTAIYASLLHYLIYYIKVAKVRHKLLKIFAFLAIVGLANFTIIDIPWELITEQLNRGKEDGIDLSYRDVIWSDCWRFITSHPLLGNGSSRYYIWLSTAQMYEHAHNSFLNLLATNGFLISGVYLLWIFSRQPLDNIKITLPIIVFSIGQFGVFWGISFMDIIFLYLMLEKPSKYSSASIIRYIKAFVINAKSRRQDNYV
ncbi:O-antigen ligase family protein [Candidatus Nomurabacteria bacterium]|nr:O-antigen ligase family protein [Candidatus Nomurabacteria bacterium]